MYFGVQVAEVKLICDAIKADWPQVTETVILLHPLFIQRFQ